MLRTLNVAIAIIRRDDRVMICRRKDEDSFGGYWEFPGGKFEPGETAERCIIREIREELAVDIRPIQAIRVFCHDYPRVRVRLHPFIAEIVQGEPQLLECAEIRWVKPPEIRGYRFPGANRRFVPMVIDALGGKQSGRGRRGRRRHRGGRPSGTNGAVLAAAGPATGPAGVTPVKAEQASLRGDARC